MKHKRDAYSRYRIPTMMLYQVENMSFVSRSKDTLGHRLTRPRLEVYFAPDNVVYLLDRPPIDKIPISIDNDAGTIRGARSHLGGSDHMTCFEWCGNV
jgi:hypothetical protein